MSHRNEKIESLLLEEAADFLKSHADIPPGVLLTVTHAILSEDHHHADVYISIFPTDRIGAHLAKFRHLQHAFNAHAKDVLRLKHMPAVRFKLDDAELKRERIEKLLEEGRE